MFLNSVDFDPTDGVDEYTNQDTGIFLSKYLSDGSYEWTVVIGGSDWDVIDKVLAVNDGILLNGTFGGEFDFDPSPETDIRKTVKDRANLFLIKLNLQSEYLWGVNIGYPASAMSRSIFSGFNGDLFLTGELYETVDFDPTPCVDERSTYNKDNRDLYLWKITKDGKYY